MSKHNRERRKRERMKRFNSLTAKHERLEKQQPAKPQLKLIQEEVTATSSVQLKLAAPLNDVYRRLKPDNYDELSEDAQDRLDEEDRHRRRAELKRLLSLKKCPGCLLELKFGLEEYCDLENGQSIEEWLEIEWNVFPNLYPESLVGIHRDRNTCTVCRSKARDELRRFIWLEDGSHLSDEQLDASIQDWWQIMLKEVDAVEVV